MPKIKYNCLLENIIVYLNFLSGRTLHESYILCAKFIKMLLIISLLVCSSC